MSELKPTGDQFNSHPMRKRKILSRIIDEWQQKDRIWQKRAEKVKEQNAAFGNLIPVSRDHGDHLLSARSFKQTAKHAYTSGLLHKAWIFLNGVKLYPDFIDFSAEQRFEGEQGEVVSENLTYLHRLVRAKGRYDSASREAQKDLIRGEGWLQRSYIMDKNGDPVRMGYSHVPWHEIRQEYGSQSVIRHSEYRPDTFARLFGKETLKKVTWGSVIKDSKENDRLLKKESDEETIGVVHYINPASLEEYIVMGGNGYFFRDLTESNFPYMDDEEQGFSPYQRRIFYDPIQDEWHGWGPIDILFGLARLETILGNATAKRAIDEADAFKIIYSNNPQEADKKYRQWESERKATGRNRPFFVSDSNTGVRMTPQNVSHGNTNANFSFWQDFIVNVATFLTDINFRALIEFAPTAQQDFQRDQLEDRVNLQVIKKNAESDKKFAIEDMIVLRNTDSKFHNEEILFRRGLDEFGPDDNIDLFTLPNGELQPKEMKVRDFLKEIKNFNYDVSPRLEGAFEDKTIKEIQNMKQDMVLLQPGTKAHQKISTLYFKSAHPQARIEADDFVTPATAAGGAPQPDETITNLQ